MSIYSFKGRRETTGEVVSGMREAASHSMLGQDLLSEGILLTQYEQRKQGRPSSTFFSAIFEHVPILERALFARYFALMLRAGLDVKHSLSTLKEQSRNKALQEAIGALHEGVERGQTLSELMIQFPNAFSEVFVSFVKVGESTGRLQESLDVLAQQLQKEYKLRKAVRGGMLYPVVIISALVAVGFAMMIFVVPKLVEVFEGFEVDLPIMTRVLISISEFFQSFWYLVIAGAFGLILIAWWLYRLRVTKMLIMQGFLYAPIIGTIMQSVNLARFSRSLSSLLTSGVSFVEALEVLGENTSHPGYARVFQNAVEHVKQGKPLSGFLQDFPRLFPALVVNIVKVGEETGALDTVLAEIALFYEDEVDQTMKNLTSIMEPVLMIVIGLAVGALAISIISPIYNLVNVI